MATLGPLGPGVKQDSCGAPTNGAEVSTDQTHISVVTDEVLTFGLKSWSRGQKSRLLLQFAQVECRPSWAPPISMHTSSARAGNRCRAHCLLGRIRSIVEMACLGFVVSTSNSERLQPGVTVKRGVGLLFGEMGNGRRTAAAVPNTNEGGVRKAVGRHHHRQATTLEEVSPTSKP